MIYGQTTMTCSDVEKIFFKIALVISKEIYARDDRHSSNFSRRATRDLIRLHVANTVDGFCDGAEQFCDDLNEYLLDNYLWMQDNIASYPDDPYWKQVNITLNQLLGMIDGYEGKLGRILSVEEVVAHPLYLLQLAGDIEDLSTKFRKPETPRSLLAGNGHCCLCEHANFA
ncbi:hypothetical protein COOONC_12755 [Cooperia oncophora]